eukprot:gene26828-35176_t
MDGEISLVGVSLAFIRKFMETYKEFNFRELSTTQVNNLIVREKTKHCKKSFCDYVQSYTIGDDSAKWEDDKSYLKRYFGKASVFVSHAWANSFAELVGAIEAWSAKSNSRSEEYFWIDSFITNQHEAEKSIEWWTTLFKQSIVDIGRAVMVMSPWNAPVYTTRAWCLYEFSIIVESKIPYDIILPPTQNARMIQELKSGSVTFTGKGYILNHLNQIDIRKAQASKKSDLNAILSLLMGSRLGFRELNRRIISALQDWIVDIGFLICNSMSDEYLARSPLPENLAMPCSFTGNFARYSALMRKVADCQSRILGADSPSTLYSLHVFFIQLMVAKAISSDASEVERAWCELEKRSLSTCFVMHAKLRPKYWFHHREAMMQVKAFWGSYYRCQSICCFHSGEVPRELMTAWKGVRRILGSLHPMTITTFINLTSTVVFWNPSDSTNGFSMIRNMKYYASLFYLSLEKHELIRIFFSYLSDGVIAFNYHRREYSASQAAYRRLKAKLLLAEDQLSTIHPNSWVYGVTLYFLTFTLFHMGEYESALLYSKELEHRPRCISGMSRLLFTLWHCYRGRSLAHMGRFNEAEELFRECLNWQYPPELGQGDNPLLPVLRLYLAETLQMRGDRDGLAVAEDLVRDCSEKLEKLFGKRHHLTLDSLEIRAAIVDRLGLYDSSVVLLREYRRRVQALIRLRRWGVELAWIDGCV